MAYAETGRRVERS